MFFLCRFNLFSVVCCSIKHLCFRLVAPVAQTCSSVCVFCAVLAASQVVKCFRVRFLSFLASNLTTHGTRISRLTSRKGYKCPAFLKPDFRCMQAQIARRNITQLYLNRPFIPLPSHLTRKNVFVVALRQGRSRVCFEVGALPSD